MSNGATPTAMVNAADALHLTEAPRTRRDSVSDSISLHVTQYVPGGASLAITSQFVGQKADSAACYEDTLFNDALVDRTNAIVGDTIVYQNVASHMRCHAGYRQLVQSEPCTIVVSSDNGYDDAPNNTIFLFTPIGLVSYRR